MRYILFLFFVVFLCCGTGLSVSAQSTTCGPEGAVDASGFVGNTFFNYGSQSRAKSSKYRTAVAVGQTFVGYLESNTNNSTLGFYARFQLAPFAVRVTATQGDLLDRIQLSWEIDALGPSPNDGFNIYRDGIFLATVGPNIRNYNDFNVIAGRPYIYTVRGLNVYGEGMAGEALGFQVPNGVVTGWVQTLNGSPVPDALVSLMPMQGFSAKFGPMDAAFAQADTGQLAFLPTANGDWTMTFWVKTTVAPANAGLIHLSPFPLYIRARNSASGNEGVEVATAVTGAPFLSANFPNATKNGWHHVALSFEGAGSMGRLYIDGVLSSLSPMNPIPSADTLNLGSRAGVDGWTGRLDELRIYHRLLDELDFREVMEGTASSLTPNLSHYWKMDEEQGTKSFDIIKRHKLYFCGATFDTDRPPVRTAGKTNEKGYYRIESASYGTGTTFLAEPMKDFYMHRALKFVRSEQDYATLPDFSLTKKATLEMWVNSAGPNGTQCLLSKKWGSNDFRVLLTPNGTTSDVKCYLNGTETNFGQLGMGYQHLAFAVDSIGSGRKITAYKNGVPFGAPFTFPGVTGNWSDPAQTWMLGARPSGAGQTDYYGGLIDELAVYDSTLAATKILEHAQNSRDPQERGLRIYFALDEGSGNRLNNIGSLLTNSGTSAGTSWTTLASQQATKPHEFSPTTRQVTLNPSITSVDQVDFTDRSTVAVSGFVRYKNTDCFANRVEILVNGESYKPQIFTDSTGRFLIDLEPGATATLTPKFEDHQFIPAFWDVTNVTSPIAGILFSDITTRKIKGQIAGGLCRKPIISGPAEDCQITVRTQDGCFEWVQVITDPDGEYEFDPLPPLEVTIAITKHNNPTIYQDFQTQGGRTIDLTKQDSIGVDFIYIAPPTVGVEGLENYYTTCKDPMHPLEPLKDVDGNPLIVLEEDELARFEFNVYEQYGPGQNPADRCLLDSAILSIDNTFDAEYDFLEPKVDTMRNQKYVYKFFAAHPNPDAPYLQVIQVTADVNGRKSTYIRKALITGIVKGEKKFTTVNPVLPSFVLRDPPGDHSYAFMEKGETVCRTMEVENSAGAGLYFSLDAAGGPQFNITPFFGVPKIKVQALFGGSGEFDLRIIKSTKTSMEYCLTATERISTDDEDLVVGGQTSFDAGQTIIAGNDVYVGTAFNFIISDAKYLTFDEMTCTPKLDVVTAAEPDSFATTYMYSEWNIENNVIRYLDSLIQDGQDLNGINSKSKQRWLDFIKMNKEAKAKAAFKRNISWDAGTQYAYTETRDTTNRSDSQTTEKFEGFAGFITELENEGGTIGYKFNLKIGAKFEGNFTQGSGESTKRGTTIGYVFKDDDPGDNWTVDIKDDPIFKTPVFEIKAGQTSCPWEVGTAHREGVKLVSLDGNTRLNVPSNGQASFKFQLQNNSQSGETFTYAFTTGPESNPHGAKIFLNGAPLDHYVYYAIPWGTTIPATITVERGPTEYNYDLFELVLLSECHDRRCNTLGFLPDLEPYLYSAVYLSVQFEEPCSEVDISFPRDGWVVKPDALNPARQNILPITISGYDKKDDDLLGIRLQYRLENGDGAWINITDGVPDYIPKANLGEVFEVYDWDTGGSPPLADGSYEIRAIALCDGAPTDNPGISHVIKGRIDRQPPSLVGTPEPSDGVFNVGDEISFTFNKPINCNKLIEADITQPNNVGLYDATTGKLIDVEISCYDNKITLVPKFQNEFFENHVLRAELHNIQDQTGNKLVTEEWEFVVDRNELAWLVDSFGLTKFESEYKTGTAAIHNRGGYPVPFKITGAPNWVRVVPSAGTLVANQILPITFEVDSSLAFGRWSDSIVLHTETGQNPFFMGGDEALPIGVRVVCRPPYWPLNPGIFENSMNMVLRLNVQGQFSADVEDIVAAYINDELRGRAHVQYVPELNAYLAYLTVYGDPGDQLLPVRLEIWDASACLRYGSVVEPFTFQPDNVIGIPNNPQVVHTNNLVLRELPFGYGWNWLSFNLTFPDNSLNAALASLNHPQNDLIKSQAAFSTYSSGAWFGSLNQLGNKTMYIYRADLPDTLKMLGNLIDPATTPLPLVAGWNWIGYIPSYSLPINEALKTLPSQPGDLIKGQLAFAQYLNPQYGWIGNLKFMQPPNGYQIKMAVPGTLTYPPPVPNRAGPGADDRGGPETVPPAFWTVNPTQFEHSMTLIGMLRANNVNATAATMELGAFVGNEVRGSAQAIYVPPMNAYVFFLTTYANTGGEQLKFKLFDSATGGVQNLTETMWFSPDLHQGSLESPVPFSLGTTGLAEAALEQSFDIQPNPFNTETIFRFALPHAQPVVLNIADVGGREVSQLRVQAREGLNTVTWDGRSDTGARLGAGVYLVRLQTEAGLVSKKVVLQR